jgi:uncharacterized protein YdhG (YjbR/CyaY superfamily)
MSIEEVDEYLRGLEEPRRNTLQTLRRTILEIVPDAEQVISYRVPAFRVGGKTVAGFAAFKNHLSYLPFSGSVIGQLPNELRDYATTKSSVHFPVDRPLPKDSSRSSSTCASQTSGAARGNDERDVQSCNARNPSLCRTRCLRLQCGVRLVRTPLRRCT